jgi:hypothetical protein
MFDSASRFIRARKRVSPSVGRRWRDSGAELWKRVRQEGRSYVWFCRRYGCGCRSGIWSRCMAFHSKGPRRVPYLQAEKVAQGSPSLEQKSREKRAPIILLLSFSRAFWMSNIDPDDSTANQPLQVQSGFLWKKGEKVGFIEWDLNPFGSSSLRSLNGCRC